MDVRSNMRTRFLAISLAILLLFLCFTTACQPTPDNIVVRNKGNNTLQNMINNAIPDDGNLGYAYTCLGFFWFK